MEPGPNPVGGIVGGDLGFMAADGRAGALLESATAAGSAAVTQWPARLLLTAVVVALMVLAIWAMARGWRRRERSQADLPAPLEVPQRVGQELTAGEVEGRYFGTSSAQSWLDRIVAHGLGNTGRAGCSVYVDGILIDRDGEPALWIAQEQITAVYLDRGMAGQMAERDGLVVITWTPGADVWWESGFRPDTTEGLREMLTATAGYRDSGVVR